MVVHATEMGTHFGTAAPQARFIMPSLDIWPLGHHYNVFARVPSGLPVGLVQTGYGGCSYHASVV